MTQPPPVKTPFELAGRAKDPIPKLRSTDKALALEYLRSPKPAFDSAVAIRLALATRQQPRREWLETDAIDFALSTPDLCRHVSDLTTKKVLVAADVVVKALARRSRVEPLPIFKALYKLAVPKAKKKTPPLDQICELNTAIELIRLTLNLIPILLHEKTAKVKRTFVSQSMGIASSLILSRRSIETSALGVDFVVTLEREAGWSALDGHSLSRIRASLLELPSLLAPDLLENGDRTHLLMLAEAVRQSRDAEQSFRSAVSAALTSGERRLPLVSRVWAHSFLGRPDDRSVPGQQHPSTTSDAAFERLALVLMNSWESRSEGEKSAYSFSIIRDVLRTGFNLYLCGEPGMEARFDPAVHEGSVQLGEGDAVKLLRPWVELRSGGDIQVLVKALVETTRQ
jgi:hypothetical protein